MYNILLTDDEQIVIDSLSFIINKNFEGQVNLYTANSGTKALEIATNEDIDIIFMDINMPGLSGLDTVSCINKLKPDIVIVILSAFDRFQYAQEAMNLGAFKYITKPVNRNVVIQTIRSAMDLIDNKRGTQTANIELHKKLDFVSPMIENDFIFACIFSKDSNVDVQSYLEYFGLTNRAWAIACVEIKNINSENQHDIYMYVRRLLSEEHRCIVSSFIMNMTIVYIPLEEGQDNREWLEILVKKFHSKLSFNVQREIRIGVSRIENKFDLIKSAYNKASSALSMVPASGGIKYAEDIPESEESEPNPDDNSNELKKKLFIKIRQGDLDGVKNLVQLYTEKVLSSEQDLNKIKNRFFEAIVTGRNIVTEIDEQYANKSFDDAFSVLNGENDIKMLCDYFKKMLLEYTADINNTKNHAENPVVAKVCDYINTHLSEELSLDQMSEYAGVSSFYLSKIFKEEKGVNYIAFVTDRRLEMGQKLLKESQLSIKEITAEIGYNDQNYFSRLFKNKFGLSPSEYRR